MSQPPEPDSERKRISTSDERAEALAAVLRDQHRKSGGRPVPSASPRRQRAGLVAFVVAFLLTAYVWFGSPSWAQPYVPPAPSPAEERAGLRMAMYLQIERIEGFRDERGRLPETLEEAGEPLRDVDYERITGEVYRLRGTNAGRRVTYVSVESPHEFLGGAHRLVLPESGGDS